MNRATFYKELEQNFADGLAIIKKKNADYAGDEDPFRNFRACETYGIPVEIGFLVRLSDKMGRLGNLLQGHEAQVKDETMRDTLIDTMNYLNLLLVYYDSTRHNRE